jgi:hypothetical protein
MYVASFVREYDRIQPLSVLAVASVRFRPLPPMISIVVPMTLSAVSWLLVSVSQSGNLITP